MRWIDARPNWHLLDFSELWAYREVFIVFCTRTLRVRYRQTIAGVAWALLRPLGMLLIFQAFFGLMGKSPVEDPKQYSAVAYLGLLAWQLFNGAVTDATAVFVNNRHLLTKVHFPRLYMPGSTVGVAAVDFLVGLLLLAPILWWVEVVPGWAILCFPLFVGLLLLVTLAACVWLAALNAIYRDVGYIVPFALQAGFFLTPVIYQTEALIPDNYRLLYGLNPVATSIEGIRWSLNCGPAPDVVILVASLCVTLVVLAGGLLYFRRMEDHIVDVV